MDQVDDPETIIMNKRLRLDSDDDDNSMRPELSVWTETLAECENAMGVVLSIGPTMGNQHRFIELKAVEARKLARYLTDAAQIAEAREAAR